MSKFIEALTAFDTNIRIREYPEISTKIESEPMKLNNDRKRYIISSQWSAMVECKPEELSHYLQLIKNQLKHEVYGDLISLLKHLHVAIMRQDKEGAKVIFEQIWKEVS
jgi:hypothetical protein